LLLPAASKNAADWIFEHGQVDFQDRPYLRPAGFIADA
jgi:hypothetical protein